VEQEGFTGAGSHPEREFAQVVVGEQELNVATRSLYKLSGDFIQVILQSDPVSEIAIKEYLGEEYGQILEILQAL